MTALLLAATLALQAQQAAPPTIQEIRVHGNVTVSDADVIAIAAVSVGAPLAGDTADAAARRLKDSGRFDVVDVRTRYRTLDMSEVALVLVVHERPGSTPQGPPPGVLRRLRSRLMFFPILDYEDGYGWTYGLRTSIVGAPLSRLRISVPLSWGATRHAAVEVDRAFQSGALSRITGSYGIVQRENPHFHVDDRRVAASVRAEKRLFDHVILGADGTGGRVTFGGIEDERWTTGADATLDTRNDPAYPSDAVLARARWSRINGVSPALGLEPAPDRYEIDLRGYKRLHRTIVFAARTEYDTSSAPLPPDEQYLLGGWQLRGAPAGALAGDRRFLWSGELRVPFTTPLSSARTGAVAFIDGGTVAPYGQSLQHTPMERGVGAGLFLVAAVIRLNLVVAHSLDGRGTRVQFGTGFSF
ncbi:MAG TPA: BamA/TamA family outer membrane protein [Vicinamibacterales bacterium]|jgi:outer membrane protein assembly factor BamA|nr:BamA/TamA family outer membrane protein [Vicinamibacterales bacterium]